MVAYSPRKAESAIRFCNRWLSTIPPANRVLVWNNPELRITPDLQRLARGWQCVHGSNAQLEFSGWQEGLDHCAEVTGSFSGVVFANDTMVAHRRVSLWQRIAFLRAASGYRSNDFVGFTSRMGSRASFQLLGQTQTCWVSTWLFRLSERALTRLHRRIWFDEVLRELVPVGTDGSLFFSDGVGPELRAHLEWWLFGGGWYRSQPLTDANRSWMTLKARSILNEKLLTGKVLSLGLRVTDPMEQYPGLQWLDALERRVRRSVRGNRGGLSGKVGSLNREHEG